LPSSIGHKTAPTSFCVYSTRTPLLHLCKCTDVALFA
jgi:hypothetical protein